MNSHIYRSAVRYLPCGGGDASAALGRVARQGTLTVGISERPPNLRAQDAHVGLIVADEAPTWHRGCRLLIHEGTRRVLDEEVCEAQVERGMWGERPLCASGQP